MRKRSRDSGYRRGSSYDLATWAVIGSIAIVFPLWGVTAAAVLLFDRFVIRQMPKLRPAFGQR